MAEKYPIPGVYTEIVDKSQYAVSLGGNQSAVAFTANRGPYAKWSSIYSTKQFTSAYGNPTHTSAFGAYIVSDISPLISARAGWVYFGSTNETAMTDYFKAQDLASGVTQPSIDVIKRRTGAFTVYKKELDAIVGIPELIDGGAVDLIVAGAWEVDIDSAAGTDFDPLTEDLYIDPNFAVWYAEYKHPERSTVHTIYGKYNAETGNIEFYNPNGVGKIEIDMVSGSGGTITATDWSSTTTGDDNYLPEYFNIYAYKILQSITETKTVLLRGYAFCGEEHSQFDGDPGSLGERLEVYIVPTTYDSSGKIDTVNVFVELGGAIKESFLSCNVQTDYADDPNQIERKIYEGSRYIRLDTGSADRVDLSNLRAITETELTVDGSTERYYAGLLPDLDSALLQIHVSSVSLDPNFYNYYDLDNDLEAYDGTLSVFRNYHGVDDIFYHNRALDEYDRTTDAAVPMTVSDMRDGIVATIGAYLIPMLASKKYDFTLAYSFINDSVNDLVLYNAWNDVSVKKNEFIYFVDLEGDSGSIPITNADALSYEESLPSNFRYGFPAYPRVQVYNSFTKAKQYMGSGFAIFYACLLNDQVADPWFAPAGYNRGILDKAIDVEVDLNENDQAELQGYPHRINPVLNVPGEGIVVLGQKSGQTKPSALDRINVVRCLFYIIKNVKAVTKYLEFEQQVSDVYTQFKRLVQPILKEVENKSGLVKAEIALDSTTTTDQQSANKEVHGSLFLEFVNTAEKWVISYVVAPTGSDFEILKQ